MIVLLVLLFIVAIIFIYFLFAPFYIEINTTNNLYRIRFHRLASVSLIVSKNSLKAEIKLARWLKQIDLLTPAGTPEKKQIVKRNGRTNKKIKIPWKKIKAVLKSFKINKCHVVIDSGNMQLNGILFPIFYLITFYTGKNVQINFVQENEIILEIENTLARISWAYISS